jgi:hypothetical protein
MAFLKVKLCSVLYLWKKKKSTLHHYTLMENEVYDAAACQRMGWEKPTLRPDNEKQ